MTATYMKTISSRIRLDNSIKLNGHCILNPRQQYTKVVPLHVFDFVYFYVSVAVEADFTVF